MKCNLTTNDLNMSFGRMHSVSGGQQLLERTLNKAQRIELQKLIESQKDNPIYI